MKRLLMITIVLSVLLSLAGCSAFQDAAPAVDSSAQAAPSTGSPAADEMSTAMQLAFGTLMLEKTSYPIDSAQAAELLPLWKAARSLSANETTAAEEENGLLAQIQATLTAQQWQAIQDLGLTNMNMRQIANELGLDFGGVGLSPSGSRPAASGGTIAPPAGFQGGEPGMMGGGPPAGGGFGGGEGGGPPGMSGSSSSTSSGASQTISTGSGSFLGIPSPILEAVIAALQVKVQE